jgi:hypothetical protein
MIRRKAETGLLELELKPERVLVEFDIVDEMTGIAIMS